MALSNIVIRPPSDGRQHIGTAPRANSAAPAQAGAFANLLGRGRQGLAPQAASTPVLGRNLVLAGRAPSDLMRAQTFNQAEADIRQSQALSGLMQSLIGNGSTLDLARSMGAARSLRALNSGPEAHFRGCGLENARAHLRVAPRREEARPAPDPAPALEDIGLGQLSARFESGGDGVAAIGYDRNGGTSYGKYQVSSRAGSLGDFLNFLDGEAPDLSKRLRASGPGNTGSRKGAMPDTWRAIAKEQPERFEQLQEAFIRKSHYAPALHSIIERTGLTEATLSPAMREVIWSTAVQHGPAGAARIFARADGMSGKPTDPAYERNLINNVYKIRVTQFGSSTSSVQAAVANRFRQEKALALAMLGGGKSTTLA